MKKKPILFLGGANPKMSLGEVSCWSNRLLLSYNAFITVHYSQLPQKDLSDAEVQEFLKCVSWKTLTHARSQFTLQWWHSMTLGDVLSIHNFGHYHYNNGIKRSPQERRICIRRLQFQK
uniref:Uncharacterized protein n=1 Tax=Glossina pallidipes TaxID=7398 RepID=A0A1A9ZKZ1_GLOPL